MLRYHRTSLLDSDAQTIVNTVNTIGVMGKGLALAFKTRYPDMFKEYKKLCSENKFQIGQLWLWKASDQWVLNFPTKKHWRHPSKIEYITAGLEKFRATYQSYGIREIAFPRLGCGNGGLDWEEVRPIMEQYLSKLPIDVYIHDFEKEIGAPEHKEQNSQSFYKLSFDCFKSDLKNVSYKNKTLFCTLENKTPYMAHFDDNSGLMIERSGKKILVDEEELFNIWSLLLNGPVMKRRLAGVAASEAYYILPILASLPYIRPIEIGFQNDDSAYAVELIENKIASDEVNSQGELEWL